MPGRFRLTLDGQNLHKNMHVLAGGALAQIGSYQIGNFTKELIDGVHYTGRAARCMGYFTQSGSGGTFTDAVAIEAARWIRVGLIADNLKGQRIPASKSWDNLGMLYGMAKRESFALSPRSAMGKLTGKMARSVKSMRKRLGGGVRSYLVTIDPKAESNVYQLRVKGSKDNRTARLVRTAKKIKVSVYAERFELGFAKEGKGAFQPGRSFMVSGLQQFMLKKFPTHAAAMNDTLQLSLERATKYVKPIADLPSSVATTSAQAEVAAGGALVARGESAMKHYSKQGRDLMKSADVLTIVSDFILNESKEGIEGGMIDKDLRDDMIHRFMEIAKKDAAMDEKSAYEILAVLKSGKDVGTK